MAGMLKKWMVASPDDYDDPDGPLVALSPEAAAECWAGDFVKRLIAGEAGRWKARLARAFFEGWVRVWVWEAGSPPAYGRRFRVRVELTWQVEEGESEGGGA